MLLGGCSETFGGGSLRFHLAYAGQMHIYSLSRSFLLYDSAFVPAQQEEPVDKHVYYALLRGRLLVREPEQSFDGPCLLRVSPSLLEGARGSRPRTFANYGEPLELVSTWIPRSLCTERRECESIEVLSFSPPIHRACALYHAATQGSGTSLDVRSAAEALTAAFVGEGHWLPETEGQIRTRFGGIVERTFEGLLRAWGVTPSLPSLSDLSGFVGISGRQLTRDIRTFADAITMPMARWRRTMFDLRLRHATTLLSAPTTSVREVARKVGYGSIEAMGRTFRDAGLPPPIAVRTALRAQVSSLREPSSTAGRH